MARPLQYGGGGFNGTLITGLAPLRDAAPGDPLPITRGYVTLGTDSGHQSSAFAANRIGEFGLNDEMLQNYAFASYKKVHDVAVAVMRAYYRQAPSKMYYFGGSEGGREGLTMAQRFPTTSTASSASCRWCSSRCCSSPTSRTICRSCRVAG